ncbi:uncharacterized protein LOC116294374 [Actinia tenebrosa]|uniref:Uncharacterized protein LOC116294374 n=1 Tax=Actinia tenebrosa TaxID=6105 RepID=A0A6P8HN85_ACTTE|nr:uncharacterized protein LOC116294374 [Actinia tenebrosa]
MRRSFYIYVLFAVSFRGFCCCKSEEVLENPHRRLDFRAGIFSSIQGYAISLVFKTLQVFDAFACVSACLEEPNCQSVNFGTSGQPKHLCELSQKTFDSKPSCKVPRSGFIHYSPFQTQPVTNDPCSNVTCKNGATCEPGFGESGFRCKCGAFNDGQYCQFWTVNISSCKDIFSKTSYRADMAYTYMIDNKQTDIYCHLSSDLCGSRGWTLVMKTDGSKNTFIFSSALWSNKNAYGLSAGKTGFDNHETKMPSYWAMPFQSLCVGMKVGNNLNWALIPYSASSLYDVIANNTYSNFTIGREKWLSLIGGSSLQQYCNNEGFNNILAVRIGIRSNNENDCNSPDSTIGFGLPWSGLTCGNRCKSSGCSSGSKDLVTFGYILINQPI